MSQALLDSRTIDFDAAVPTSFAPRIAAADPGPISVRRPTDRSNGDSDALEQRPSQSAIKPSTDRAGSKSDVSSRALPDFNPANASLLTQLEWRIRRDAWAAERDDLANFTRDAAGDPTGDVLVVRAHVRKGTNPRVRSTLAEFQLYDRGDAYRGSSHDLVFVESLALIQHLVHVFRPADAFDSGGTLMRNELQSSYDGAGVHGDRFVWHAGEFMSIEVSQRRSSVYWSTDISLAALARTLQERDLIQSDAIVEYQIVRSTLKPGLRCEDTWTEFRELVDSGSAHIGAASVDAKNFRVWWGEARAARFERYPSMALTFASRDIEKAAADYVEATGTADVRARGRQALKSVLSEL